jgi:hypothetical protein
MSAERHVRRKWVPIALAIIAAAGAALAFYATSQGIGTEVDSATYLMAARSLVAGRGLSLPVAGSEQGVPMTGFPPLLPVALAAIGYIGIEPLAGARWLNIALLGADIFLLSILVRRYTRSDPAAIFSGLLLATTVDVLVSHCMLVSEPLFLCFTLAGLIAMAGYIDAPTLPLLFTFSAAFAAAGLTRYIGVSLLPIGAGAIAFSPEPLRLRRVHLGVYMGVFAFPLFVWVMRNRLMVRAFTNRSVAFHPPGLGRFLYSYFNLSTWLLPAAFPALIRVMILTAALVLTLRPLWQKAPEAGSQRARWQMDRLLIAFLCSYICGFLVTQTFFDAQIWIAGRHLLLVYVIGSAVVISQSEQLLHFAGSALRVTCLCLCLALLGLGTLRTTRNALKAHREGIGFSSRRWQDSELIAKTAGLDNRVPIITNSRAVVYLRTGKVAYALPSRVNSQTDRLDPQYASESAWVSDELQRHGAVIVYFTVFQPGQFVAPAEDSFETLLGLRRLVTTREGYMLARF